MKRPSLSRLVTLPALVSLILSQILIKAAASRWTIHPLLLALFSASLSHQAMCFFDILPSGWPLWLSVVTRKRHACSLYASSECIRTAR
eukprot:6213499-Pleurochrysis_carterae.AAC.1